MFYVRRRTEAYNVCWESFQGRIEPGQAWTGCWRKLIPLTWRNVRKAALGRPRSVRTSEFREASNLWRSSSAVMKVLCMSTKIRTKLEGRWTFHCRLFGALQGMIFGWKIYKRLSGYYCSIDGATLFSKVVSSKLRSNVKNGMTFILCQIWCRSGQYLKLQAVKQGGPVFWATLHNIRVITLGWVWLESFVYVLCVCAVQNCWSRKGKFYPRSYCLRCLVFL